MNGVKKLPVREPVFCSAKLKSGVKSFPFQRTRILLHKNRRIKKMKLVIIEPLGVEKEKLLALAEEKLEGKVEIVYLSLIHI